jgi:GAF domain-containing protein
LHHNSIYDDVKDAFSFPVGYGLRDPAAFQSDIPGTDGLAGEMVRENQPLIVEDVEQHPILGKGKFARREGVRSTIGRPLAVCDRSVGLLFLSYRSPHRFSESEKQLVATYAAQAAIAIRNAGLLQDAEQQARDLINLQEIGLSLSSSLDPKEVLTSTVELATKALGIDVITLHQYDVQKATFRQPVTGGNVTSVIPQAKGEGIVARALLHNEPLFIERVAGSVVAGDFTEREGIKSTAVLPLTMGAMRVGVLFANYRRRRVFTEHEKRVLRIFASQVALALANATLVDDLSQRAQEVATLHNIGLALASTTDSAKSLRLIIENAVKVMRADSAAVYVYDPVRDEFFLPAVVDAKFPYHPPPGKGEVASRVIDGKKLVTADDAPDHPVLSGTFTREHGVRSCASLPLIADGQAVGILFVNYLTAHAFTEDEETLLEAFGNQAAVAIATARLTNQLSILHGVGQAITEPCKSY